MTHNRLIVVSIHKSGTNLLARLFRAIGYRVVGAGIRESYPEIAAAIAAHPRISSAITSRTIFAHPDILLELCAARASVPTCVFLHHSRTRSDQQRSAIVRGWPIIFNYRDPRAVVSSFVHYLTGEAREKSTDVEGFQQLAQVLMRLPTVAERVSFVIRYVPDYLRQSFAANAWLLTHEGVIAVRYEALVGNRGGGSDWLQRSTVAGILSALSISADVSAVASFLYSETERTFRSGTIDGWRSDFSPELLDRFNASYGDLLETYGYATPECPPTDAPSM